MKLRTPSWPLPVLSLLASTLTAVGQGTFRNLDFESATLTPVPPGQSGGPVSSLSGIPYWTGYLGTNQQTQVLHNDEALGNASIDILGPYLNGGVIIEGQYTVVLQPGDNGFSGIPGDYLSASISQTNLVPAYSRSLQFKAQAFSPFSVSLLGQTLALRVLGTGANYNLYGADISSLAGQTGPLTITALAGPNSADYFDSFVFSSSAVPEPSVLVLSALAALLVGRRFASGKR